MTRREKYTPTRRTLLSTMGTGLAAGLLGSEAAAKRNESGYVLVQGDECVPIRPVRGRLSVGTFYDYQLPQKYVSDANGATPGSAAAYSSAGTTDFQQSQTSAAFLYQGPEGLSLVVVHGSLDDADGGAVTFRLSGLPEDGEWVVLDDRYRNPETGDIAASNFDRWQVEGTDHRIDWTWGSSGTDGGVFRGLGDDFEVVIDPAFNEAATLYGDHYEGEVTDWEFLSGSAGVSERIPLTMDQPIRITTGSCGGDAASGTTGQRDDRKGQGETKGQEANDGQQKDEQQTQEQEEKEQEEKEERKEEKEEKKEERKEEKQEEKEERKEEKEERKEEKQEKKEERKEEREENRGKGNDDDDGDDDDDDEEDEKEDGDDDE